MNSEITDRYYLSYFELATAFSLFLFCWKNYNKKIAISSLIYALMQFLVLCDLGLPIRSSIMSYYRGFMFLVITYELALNRKAKTDGVGPLGTTEDST